MDDLKVLYFNIENPIDNKLKWQKILNTYSISSNFKDFYSKITDREHDSKICYDEDGKKNFYLMMWSIWKKKILSIKESQLGELVASKDFSGVFKYLDRYYNQLFPYKHMRQERGLSEVDVEDIIAKNVLVDGYLYHVTPSCNVNGILEDGLLTLNDKYGCDMYHKSNEVNDIYSRVKERNKKEDIMKMRQLIRIPGITGYEKDRFNNVFLTSSLDYALKTYGENGELSKFFIRDILWAFGVNVDFVGLSKTEIKNLLLDSILKNKIDIYITELNILLAFIDCIYEECKAVESNEKAIVMVPVKDIVSNSSVFKEIFNEEGYLSWPLEVVLDYNDGEIQNVGSIEPDKLIVVDTNKDGSFSLKKK